MNFDAQTVIGYLINICVVLIVYNVKSDLKHIRELFQEKLENIKNDVDEIKNTRSPFDEK